MTAQLTAKETALMTAIAEDHFSFFDQGLVHGSGIWTECMTDEIVGSSVYKVSETRRGVASVINSLGKKGLLITDTNEDGAWTDLSPEGEAWVNAHNAPTEAPAETEEAPAAEEAPEAAEAPAEVEEEVVYHVGDIVTTKQGNYNWEILAIEGNRLKVTRIKENGQKKTTYRLPASVTLHARAGQ